jgi:acylphosphatase
MTELAKTTVHVRITGRVQGVGYRAWAQKTARKLGLSGWVRNVTDGTVEAIAHGNVDAVDQFIAACQAGPLLARVTAVDKNVIDAPGSKSGFPETGFYNLGTFTPEVDPKAG